MQRIIIFTVLVLLLMPFNLIFSASINFQPEQLTGGQIYSYDNNFQISLPAGDYSFLDIYTFTKTAEDLPANTRLVSQVYEYYILSPEVTDQSVFSFQLKFDSNANLAKHIYHWNYQEKSWQFLNTSVNLADQMAKTSLSGRKGRLAVLEFIGLESSQTETDFAGQFTVKLPKGAAGAITRIDAFAAFNYPGEEDKISDIYQFDIKFGGKLDFSEPIELAINLPSREQTGKAIFYWDNNRLDWVELPSWVDFYQNRVVAYTHLPFSRVTLFEKENQFIGEASWYSWQGGNFAASRDFPFGTKLKVTNITRSSSNFGKSVVVIVNDYGPAAWTGRIIDLDKAAYRQIGYLSGGIMPVKVELLKE